ncbi:hypothetical protein E2562_005517 [Oryza meyeriana var. granulata]|uniref:Uncharacterized protein n=1 Tax=Oryza meyeriana var. granulata TaxID=110450 RepID=A0A6G1F402_9ORYZ|nr:hypothetical protein E2562_005517 [Oryza meyeriana var. granulata]
MQIWRGSAVTAGVKWRGGNKSEGAVGALDPVVADLSGCSSATVMTSTAMRTAAQRPRRRWQRVKIDGGHHNDRDHLRLVLVKNDGDTDLKHAVMYERMACMLHVTGL